jgi:lysyl-tRNA synthetase class 2
MLARRCLRNALARRARACRLLSDSQRTRDAGSVGQIQYRELRERELGALQAAEEGFSPYPRTPFRASLTLGDFTRKYMGIPSQARLHDVSESVAGRIRARRQAGKLVFLDLEAQGVVEGDEPRMQRLQLICSDRHVVDKSVLQVLRVGDVVGVTGFPGKSGTGELSLLARQFTLLAPCLHDVPKTWTDQDLRYRQRYVDLRVTEDVAEHFRVRARVISALRRFLDARGFLEVETPILWPKSGGALARPFATRSRTFGSETDLFLRVAPELFLKQLVIGGLERVYEVGKVFRNEGADALHNPEFTICEFYQAYATYEDLMLATEALLAEIVRSVTGGSTRIRIAGRDKGGASGVAASAQGGAHIGSGHVSAQPETDGVEVDFAEPFARLDIMTGLERELQTSLPDPNAADSAPRFLEICQALGLHVPKPHTTPRLIDKLVGHVLEPQCTKPTFLLHHPESMSPLAQSHPTRAGLTQRFELYIGGHEICNSYTELNDPREQRRRLALQLAARGQGDDEALPPDEDFCQALEYGLPPTAGWGMGIDRLVMLLTGRRSIRVRVSNISSSSCSPPLFPCAHGCRVISAAHKREFRARRTLCSSP